MTEPHDLQIVARREPFLDEIELVGNRPGPAGIAIQPLLDGRARFLVDYAEPERFCALHYPVGEPAITSVLDALTIDHGPALAAAIETVDERPRVVWPDPDLDATPSTLYTGSDPSRHLPAWFGHLTDMAILRSDLDSLSRPVAVELLDALDYTVRALTVETLRPIPHPGEVLAEVVERLEGLDATAIGEMTEHADDAPGRLARLLGRAHGLLPFDDDVLARRLRRQIARLDAVGDGQLVAGYRPVPVASMPLARESLAGAAAARRASPRIDLPVDVADSVAVEVVNAHVDGPELTVGIRLPGDASTDSARSDPTPGGPWWLRVVRIDATAPGSMVEPVLVAMAPFEPAAFGGYAAVALLPDGVGAEALHAEVTSRPDLPWQRDPERQIRRAIAEGQRASRLDRNASASQAEGAWQATARAWEAVGDAHRADEARRRAARAAQQTAKDEST